MLRYPIYEHQLGNGLRVVVSPDDQVPQIATHLVFRAGSRDDPRGKQGLAYLFEHLLLDDLADDDVRLIQAWGGICGATVTSDLTSLHAQVPAGALALALQMQADRMTKVVMHEGRALQRACARSVYGKDLIGSSGTWYEPIPAALVPAGHPYRHAPFGTVEQLEAITLDDVARFSETYHRPCNAVLAIVGNVHPLTAFAAAKKCFADIPSGAPRPLAGTCELPPLPLPARREVTGPATDHPVVHLAFRLPGNDPATPGIVAAEAALDIVTRRARARLLDEAIAHAAIAQVDPRPGVSIGLITVKASTPRTAVIETVLAQELGYLVDAGPDSGELDRWRARAEAGTLRQLARLRDRAEALATQTAAFDAPQSIKTGIADIRGADARQVQRIAARWLRPHHAATVTVRPRATRTKPTAHISEKAG